MLGKVLKYDMKFIARFWWILAASVAGMSLMASAAIRFLITTMSSKAEPSFIEALITVAAIFFVFISFIAIFGSLAVTEVMVFVRFYKNFFTDEGYLTFTLPVSRKTLLLSKTLNALIWFVLHTALLLACAVLIVTLAVPHDMLSMFMSGVWYTLGTVWKALGAWLIVYIFEAIVLFTALALFTLCLIQLCITVGSIIAKKLKVLAAVGIYYVTNMVLSTVGSIAFTILFGGGAEGFVYMLSNMSAAKVYLSIALILLVAIVAVLAAVAVVYNMTRYRIERKLNLA